MRLAMLAFFVAASLAAAPGFQIRLADGLRKAPVDGRLILVVSKNLQSEPRFQVAWGIETQQIFGLDVDGWKPGDAVEMRGNTPGSPLRTIGDLPPGKYSVQAVLKIYETFRRADGHVLKLHPDHGEASSGTAPPAICTANRSRWRYKRRRSQVWN